MRNQLIKVEKEKLLDILRTNREQHRAIFEEALEGWKAQVLERLEEMVKLAREGKVRDATIDLPRPSDHTSDYDRVIGMLELDVDDHVELDDQEYATYVQDDWGWRQRFLTSNSGYSQSARTALGDV